MTNLKCIHILTALVYSDIFYVSEIITMQMYIRKDNLLSSAVIHYLFTTTSCIVEQHRKTLLSTCNHKTTYTIPLCHLITTERPDAEVIQHSGMAFTGLQLMEPVPYSSRALLRFVTPITFVFLSLESESFCRSSAPCGSWITLKRHI